MAGTSTYVVRKGGKVHFEGDLPALRAWLADNRIHSDDEVRRQGFEVLEGERLWSLVKDRTELGFDNAAERRQLIVAKRSSRIAFISCVTMLAIIIALLFLNQGIPRYDSSAELKLVRDAHSKEVEVLDGKNRSLRAISDEQLSQLEDVRKSNASLSAKVAELEQALASSSLRLNDKFSSAADAWQRREQELLRQIDILGANLQQQLKRNEELARVPSFDRALSISWNSPPFGSSYLSDKYLSLKNLTGETLNVRISILSPISHEYSVTIEPNSAFNSSQHLNAPLMYAGYQLRLTILGSKYGSVKEVTVK